MNYHFVKRYNDNDRSINERDAINDLYQLNHFHRLFDGSTLNSLFTTDKEDYKHSGLLAIGLQKDLIIMLFDAPDFITIRFSLFANTIEVSIDAHKYSEHLLEKLYEGNYKFERKSAS